MTQPSPSHDPGRAAVPPTEVLPAGQDTQVVAHDAEGDATHVFSAAVPQTQVLAEGDATQVLSAQAVPGGAAADDGVRATQVLSAQASSQVPQTQVLPPQARTLPAARPEAQATQVLRTRQDAPAPAPVPGAPERRPSYATAAPPPHAPVRPSARQLQQPASYGQAQPAQQHGQAQPASFPDRQPSPHYTRPQPPQRAEPQLERSRAQVQQARPQQSRPEVQQSRPHVQQARPAQARPEAPGERPARRGTEPTAVGALLTGLLGIVVPLVGVLAVVLGGIGMERTRRRGTGGRGMAATGLTLGSVQVVLTAVVVVGGMIFWNAYGDAIERTLAQAEELTQLELSVPGVALEALTGGMSFDDLRDLAGTVGSADELKGLADQCQVGDTSACQDLLGQVPDSLVPDDAEAFLP